MGFIGDAIGSVFGGKGGSSQPAMPAPQMGGFDLGAVEGMMMNFENMMMGAMGSIAQAQMAAQQQQETLLAQMDMNAQMPAMPAATRDTVIDWTETQDQLQAKNKADYHLDQLRRKGATDTVLTSPLLEDEEPSLGSSVLTGS